MGRSNISVMSPNLCLMQQGDSGCSLTLTELTAKPIDDALVYFGSQVLPYRVRQITFEGALIAYLLLQDLSRDPDEWAAPLSFEYYREQLGHYLDPVEALAFEDRHWIQAGNTLPLFITKADLTLSLVVQHIALSCRKNSSAESVSARLLKQMHTPQLFRICELARLK